MKFFRWLVLGAAIGAWLMGGALLARGHELKPVGIVWLLSITVLAALSYRGLGGVK